jgi:arylsulfatase A-like enzyme
MIISGPGIAQGVVDPTLVSLLDIMPTWMDLAGKTPLPFLDGYSLLPLLNLSSSDT